MGFDQGSCRGRDSIIIWDAESGENIRTLEGHSEAVYSVDITPDNKKVVSGSRDKTAKIWSMDDGKLLYTFQGHTNYVYSVAVHPSGEFLATGSEDKTWKLWSLKAETLLYTSEDTHMIHKESPRLEKEVEGLWKTLEISEDDQKAFKEKVEAAGKLKQAGLTLLNEELDRLWEMESETLMEEFGLTVEDLDPKLTDTESKNKALKDLKKKREEVKQSSGCKTS